MEAKPRRHWHYFWEKTEPPQPLSRNSRTFTVVVGFFNLFNLVWSGWFALDQQALSRVFGIISGTDYDIALPTDIGMRVALGWFPLVFSLLFFTIPLVRWVMLRRSNDKRAQRNRQREVLRQIVEQYAEAGEPQPMRPGTTLSAEELQTAQQVYDGDYDLGDAGAAGYTFERLRAELQTAKVARAQVDSKSFALGRIEYASDE